MTDKIAYIREAECIGCIKCIKACSDQAILGARKLMHTIITDLCTGCEDCIAVCPVDCIEMVAGTARMPSTHKTLQPVQADNSLENPTQNKKDLIAQAVARTLARRGWKPT